MWLEAWSAWHSGFQLARRRGANDGRSHTGSKGVGVTLAKEIVHRRSESVRLAESRCKQQAEMLTS
jgi:hypothetical protein